MTLLLPLVALAALLGDPPPRSGARETIVIEELLVIQRLGRGGRTPVPVDALEAARVRGVLGAPSEGELLGSAEGRQRAWRSIRVDGAGRFADVALRGGHGFAVLELAQGGVWMLEARGHKSVLVNGVPRGGDLYDLGLSRLPVELVAGRNELLFEGGRGSLAARLVPPPAPVFLLPLDRTLPDLAPGQNGPVWIGISVVNATQRWQRDLELLTGCANAPARRNALPALPPCSTTKVGVLLELPEELVEGRIAVELDLVDGAGQEQLGDAFDLAVLSVHEVRRHTFRSGIDGSVQHYALNPMRDARGDGGEPGEEQAPALILSLHGAGVDALGQARSYASKDWAHIVAPTNRRPYGFDWEDWGRLDALEVLELAAATLGADPRRTYLTGHSMGGHGTWNLGAHHMDRFAAIAPSAGWRDFWSYGGAAEWDEPDAVEALLARAANPSRTALLESNYALGGVYVLHGDADDNVPVSEARHMRARLAGFHPNFAYYERPGAGHWWGAACVDWPPLLDFLLRNTRPRDMDAREFSFATANPGVAARCRWLTVAAQHRWLEPTRVRARLAVERREIELETSNAAHLVLHLCLLSQSSAEGSPPALPPGEPLRIAIDGDLFDAPWPGEDGLLHLARDPDGAWSPAGPRPAELKGPQRAGPFKDVFRNGVVLVAGSAGTPEENAWSLAKARYDAETFAYRGNGAFEVRLDTDFDPAAEPDRNVVLYGNRDTHRLWEPLLGRAPIDVRRGSLTVGERLLAGDDLACLFLYPRPGSARASVGAIAGTGPAGGRLTEQLPLFVSGVAYPDWIVLEPGMLEHGSRGVVGAGFFAGDWSLGSDLAWRADER